MYITIDTSAIIAVIGNEESRKKIINSTKGCSLCAPESVHWEIGNAFSAMFKRRNSNIDLAKKALKAYRKIPIKFLDISLEQALEIAYSQNIYAYDAYLLQCARQTNAPLLTLDKHLMNIAQRIGIKQLEIDE